MTRVIFKRQSVHIEIYDYTIIGIYETMRRFGYVKEDELGYHYYTEEADRFGKKIFDVIHRTKDQFMLDVDYKINLEQIPKHHWGYAA